MKPALCALVLCLALPALASDPIRLAWKGFSGSRPACGDDAFDYFPGGGMRSVYCHALGFLKFDDLKRLAGGKVFAKGPHGSALVLDSESDFGRYDHAFVRWAAEHLIPGAADPELRDATLPVYRHS